MYRSSAKRLSAFIVSAGTFLFLAGATLLSASGSPQTPTVSRASRTGKSIAMRDYRFNGPFNPGPPRAIRNDIPPPKGNGSNRQVVDPVAQKRFGTTQPGELAQFDGLSDDDVAATLGGIRYVPPDTNGDIGPNHYVEYINTIWSVYDRSGTLLLGPLPGNSFWQGLGGNCQNTDDGDPIVKYDRMANRWMASQFFVHGGAGPFGQCIAISMTGDPTGSWFQYEFPFSSTDFTDYPKLAIWPDAYYMTQNIFGSVFYGGAFAFNRAKMLVGDPTAEQIFFTTTYGTFAEGGVEPSDLNGVVMPPAGAPNYFMTFDVVPSPDPCAGACLLIWQFHSDFVTPANSTFTGPAVVPVPAFNVPVCGSFRDQCVPQLGSSELLETLSGDLMYPLPYRNFGDHEAILASHTVGDGTGIAQVRWYEIRDPGGSPVAYQASTYAPDSTHRWMPSIAMDRSGNIALNYSRSDTTLHPQAAITGRLATDPLSTMGSEDVWYAGAGSQTASFNRWGDYTSIFLDPVDDCTFWAINEYYPTTSSFNWHTRIGSFKFPSCVPLPSGTLEGTVTDGTNPIPGATVTAGAFNTTTNIAGHYSFTLPPGSYDMTASKFGFSSGSALGVVVTDAGDTIQNFVLVPAASFLVNGVVKDGSGEGWPLYARIHITAPGYGGKVIYTDPVTGYYSIILVGSVTYNFEVSAVSPGYITQNVSVPVNVAAPADPGGIVQNFDLLADLVSCSAPGYGGGPVSASFSDGTLPPGWTLKTNAGSPWHFYLGGDPCGLFPGNLTGGSGGYAIVNSNCDGIFTDDNELRTPSIDLSAASSALIQWNNDYKDLSSIADVDISLNGGTSWTNVWERAGVDERGPGVQTVDISGLATGQSSVQARFHFQGFWAWWWQVDNVIFGHTGACAAKPGGLVVGNVRDANTGLGLNGATVVNLPADGITTTFATPEDPNQDDGLYILFAGSGLQPFEASLAKYNTVDKSTVVIPNSTVRLDFSLPAGLLAASPRPLQAKVNPGDTTQQILSISNTGTGAGHFDILEINAPLSTAPAHNGPFASAEKRKEALARIASSKSDVKNFFATSTKGLPAFPNAPTDVPTLAAGEVINTYPSGLIGPWGVSYNTDANDFWVGSLAALGGDNKDHRFLTDGTNTGDTIDQPWVAVFAADGAYNARTGMLWRVNVGGDNCIYEENPTTKVSTGNKICPAFVTSERGLAYDFATDTYYSGSWNDMTINHFDSSGTILDSAFVGLNISGLAFNPSNGHLFVMVNWYSSPFDVYVLDTRNNYFVVGAFRITSNGVPVFTNFGGAGLEADCDGNLWLIDQNTKLIYKVASGEAGWCVDNIPWLSEDPTSGTVPGVGGTRPTGGTNPFPVTVTFDSAGLFPGLRQGQLQILTDTPYQVPGLGVNFTVRFLDVLDNVPPGTDPYENFIYAAAGANIMHGCSFFDFCPSALVTRADMAGYVWKSVHGAFAEPPAYTGIFSDVFFGDYNSDYIQGVFDDGITVGCQAPGNPLAYCPNQSIPRGQMAVFIEKGVRGSSFVPPACAHIFTDVSCPPTPADPYGDWVELLFNDHITVGCGPNLFCPLQPIPNEQMATFIVKAFGFPVLP
jgi:hypothetical protein